MSDNPLKKLKLSNVILPIVIGLGYGAYVIYNGLDNNIFSSITLTWHAAYWIGVALLCMVGRDLGYVMRLRILSNNELSWLKCLRIIMLWEFTSAVTPSAVGGTSVAIIFVHKEGLSVGRSTSIVLLTSFLDELYFIIMFPLLMLIVGLNDMFTDSAFMTFVLTGYGLKLAYLLLVSYGLFFNPRGFKWLIVWIFKLRFLRRWRVGAAKTGDDIILSSAELKSRRWGFWGKAMGATFLSWSSRYFVANALILGFFAVSDHILLFARQLAMWIMMLVMPTPGGSGFAEYIFSTFLSDQIPVDAATQTETATVLALLWRLITYYPYIIIGIIILPRWLRRNFGKK